MKYLIIVLDGLSENDSNKTSLELSNTPNLDYIVQHSELGVVNCVPDNLLVASDVANMSILGYNPNKYYTGRAYLELRAHNMDLKENEIVYRVNIVNIKDSIMHDFTSDNISDSNAYTLLKDSSTILNKNEYFIIGSSYHHLLVTRQSELDMVPPHEIISENISKYLSSNKLSNLIESSSKIINGRFNASNLWIWGRSTKVSLPSFESIYKKNAALISAVDVIKGLGYVTGIDVIEVDGTTGSDTTSYENKINKTLSLFDEGYDLVYLHIEACDYCSHVGSSTRKVKAIEDIDNIVIRKIKKINDIRCLILPDHHSSTKTKKHHRGAVPVMFYDSKNKKNNDLSYMEKSFDNALEYYALDLLKKLIEK